MHGPLYAEEAWWTTDTGPQIAVHLSMTVTDSGAVWWGTRCMVYGDTCGGYWYPVVRVRAPFPTVSHCISHCGLYWTLLWPVLDPTVALFRVKTALFRVKTALFRLKSVIFRLKSVIFQLKSVKFSKFMTFLRFSASSGQW